MIATVLSMNMRKLLKAKVLVRKLLGIETAGSLTVLFSDKTGTLTQGLLQVADTLDGTGKHHSKLDEIPDGLRKEITSPCATIPALPLTLLVQNLSLLVLIQLNKPSLDTWMRI